MLTLLLPPKTKQSGDDCVCCGLLSSQVACRLRAARRQTRGSTNASPATAPECATPHPLIFTWEVGSASAHNAGKYLPPRGLPLSPAVWFEPVPEHRGSTGGSWLDPYGALRSLQGDPGAPWLLTVACQSCRAAAQGCATLRKVKCGPKQCARVSATISLLGPEKNEQLWLPRGRSPLPHKGSPLSGSGKVPVLLVWVWEEGRILSASSTELFSPLDLPRSQQEGVFSLLACVPADFPFASSNLSLVPRAWTLAMGRDSQKAGDGQQTSLPSVTDSFVLLAPGTDDRGIGFSLMPPWCSPTQRAIAFLLSLFSYFNLSDL